MIQVRRNVFETNSSSTHSLAVPQNFDTWHIGIRKRKLVFHLGSFGRPTVTVKVKPTDYLYTAIMKDIAYIGYSDNDSDNKRDEITSSSNTPDWRLYCKEVATRLDKLKAILDSYNIIYEFEEPVWDLFCECKGHKVYDFYRSKENAITRYWIIEDLQTGKKEKHPYIDRDFGIDHSDEVDPLIDMLLANPEECIKFLLGGKVFVGSDEANEIQCAKVHWNEKTYDEYYLFDTKKNKEVKRWNKNVEYRTRPHDNPYYMEGYNYYYKGN